MLLAIARGLALFLGAFSTICSTCEMGGSRFSGNGWWINLPGSNRFITVVVLLGAGIGLFAFGLRPNMSTVRHKFTLVVLVLLAATAAFNAWEVWTLAWRGEIGLRFPLPFSFLVLIGLGVMLGAVILGEAPLIVARPWVTAATALCATLCFPLALMFCFGKTDYRRKADVAVVFGARAYADGTPSQALYDRVRTGVDLYREGYVSRLIMSGGSGDGAFHETEVMRALAVELGVPGDVILVDRDGLNTQATVRNTLGMCDTLHAQRVLVVSHGYHLPRVKLCYQRLGQQVYTVPAREKYLLTQMPYFMAREIAALWMYWLPFHAY